MITKNKARSWLQVLLADEEALPLFVCITTFLAALGFSLWAATVGWTNSILDEHGFRQTQTAITAFYLKLGSPFWRYETPVLGAPWAIPMEVPVYQWLVAQWSNFSGMPLEQAGRLISRCAFYATLIPLWYLGKFFEARRYQRLALLTLFLVSPIYLFWSRTFMIEQLALFLNLSYLVAGLFALRSHRLLSLAAILALGFGTLGALTKSTTFAGFGFALGLSFLWTHFIARGNSRVLTNLIESIQKPKFWGDAIILLCLPLASGILWAKISNDVRALNPLADFLLNESLKDWNFGTLDQRLSADLWYMFFRKTMHDAIGHRTTWLLSLCLLAITRKYWRQYLLALCLFLFPPLLFTNLYIVHNYYACASAIFLVLGLFAAIRSAWESKERYKVALGYVLFFVALSLSVRQFLNFGLPVQRRDFPSNAVFGALVRDRIPPGQSLLIYGSDWDSTIPYYVERKAIMDRNWRAIDSKEMQVSLAALTNSEKIGAVLFCGARSGTEYDRVKQKTLSYLNFDPIPAISHVCDVHLPK